MINEPGNVLGDDVMGIVKFYDNYLSDIHDKRTR